MTSAPPGPDQPGPDQPPPAEGPAPVSVPATVAPGSRPRSGLVIGLVAGGVALAVLCSAVGAGALWLTLRNRPGHRTAAAGTVAAAPAQRGGCDWPPTSGPHLRDVGTPPLSVRRSGPATMTITTNLGAIEVRMDRSKTPCTIASFEYLGGRKFFDGSACHRLTTQGIFVLQCGDPSGTGQGGPAYRFADENLPGYPANLPYARGTVAMANAGPDTNGSQFFINYADEHGIPPNYAVIGTVVRGMDIVDRVAAGGCDNALGDGDGAPRTRIEIQSLTVTG